MVVGEIATGCQNYDAVKIMTDHNFDWRKMRKKKSGKRKMDLLKYKLKINHSTLCVRLPKDQCHTQLKVFTDQYNWISVLLKSQKCARQEKKGIAWGFGSCNSRRGGGNVWEIFFLHICRIDSFRGREHLVSPAAATFAPL